MRPPAPREVAAIFGMLGIGLAEEPNPCGRVGGAALGVQNGLAVGALDKNGCPAVDGVESANVPHHPSVPGAKQ